MSQPLVSVVIPTFNYGHFVCEAVESVLAQTYTRFEIIVVDDGSTDDTRERLAPYQDRIRYHYQDNAGLSAARNTGIRLAKGELIALLDSDDTFHPQKLELQVQYMRSHDEVGLLATQCVSERPTAWPTFDITTANLLVSQVTLDELTLKSRFGSCGVLVRKRCFEAAGLFDTDLKSAEDRDMWIRIAACDGVAIMQTPLWWYRPTPGSMSRNAAKMEQYERIVLDKTFNMPSLKLKWRLRHKALGLAAYSAAYMYLMSNDLPTARRRMLASFAHWPFPIHVPDVSVPFGRMRLLARTIIGKKSL